MPYEYSRPRSSEVESILLLSYSTRIGKTLLKDACINEVRTDFISFIILHT